MFDHSSGIAGSDGTELSGYELSAVIQHLGTTPFSGHYVAQLDAFYDCGIEYVRISI